MPGLTVLRGCRTLQLSRGMNTLIDEADWPTVGGRRWHAISNRITWYARRNTVTGSIRDDTRKWTAYFMHRDLMDSPPKGIDVDHINGDSLDNRRANLRLATRMQNGGNRRRSNRQGKSSRFKGVCRGKNGKPWQANVRVGGRLIYLGCYEIEEDAARAYDAAAREHFGEFACTNADIHGGY